jgi:allophanate hydrolase
VVRRLRAAGALLIGKTNLDQFATGLVGTRSPYGAVPNTFNPAYVSGGSSSGSASVVARGLVAFSLGTDTAGSGRVPAGFNNIVGLKPTRGAISARGMLPACRTLDCVSIFALTAADAQAVLAVAAGYDAADAYSRSPGTLVALPQSLRIGVPRAPEFFGDALQTHAYDKALARARAFGATIIELDFGALAETAALLYQGPWVAERHAAIEAWMRERPEEIDPTVRAVIGQATKYSATDAFKAQYRLEELRRMVTPMWADIDVLMVPTAPTIYTIAQVNADPVAKNSHLGTYTNFVNFLDMSAIAVPASLREDGLPFGVTFIAPAWGDAALCELAQRWQACTGLSLGATGVVLPAGRPAGSLDGPGAGQVRVAVVGAHLTGMPLNHQLTSRSARLVRQTRSAASYRLFALPGTTPPKPGLKRVESGGAAIVLELWDMPLANFGSFVEEVPAPLAIGTVELDDGTWTKGFVCEPLALEGATDITHFGGWRAYIASRA